ncbi:tyrosine-type recombinase/integrase [Meridianimaribacter flavus]
MSYLVKFQTILELKRYSVNTIKVYINFMKKFKETLNVQDEKLELLSDIDVINTIVRMVKVSVYSMSSQKQLIGAVGLFYKELCGRTIDFSSIYPTRREHYLPHILSKEEVKDILQSVDNMKHKAVLATIYGLGLRVSEVIDLKIENIDSRRMIVHIQNAKGKKDRVVMLPVKLLKLLRVYFVEFHPKVYLFEGQNKGKYSASSIRKIFKNALAKAQVKKPATVHTLRHTFATHLLENGTDIRIIQKLLGHNNINTTLQYTQVAQTTIESVKSPLDLL